MIPHPPLPPHLRCAHRPARGHSPSRRPFSALHGTDTDWLEKGLLQRLVLVVTSAYSNEVLERWTFEVQTDAATLGGGCAALGRVGAWFRGRRKQMRRRGMPSGRLAALRSRQATGGACPTLNLQAFG
jgi:hypothetical protein